MQALRRLSRRRSARSESGSYLVDGPVLLAEALAAGVELIAVFVEPSAVDDPAVREAAHLGVEVREVEAGALGRVLDVVTPQAVVAVARSRVSTLPTVLDAVVDLRRPLLVLVGLQDPGNAGTLVRVAEAAGCVGVVLTERSVDVHNPKTVRATAGSLFRLPIVEGVSVADVLSSAAAAEVPTWATVRSGGVALDDADLSGGSVLLVGSESHGLSDDVCDAATGRVSIPMEGGAESLNAGVAGALVAFEAARQRRAGAR